MGAAQCSCAEQCCVTESFQEVWEEETRLAGLVGTDEHMLCLGVQGNARQQHPTMSHSGMMEREDMPLTAGSSHLGFGNAATWEDYSEQSASRVFDQASDRKGADGSTSRTASAPLKSPGWKSDASTTMPSPLPSLLTSSRAGNAPASKSPRQDGSDSARAVSSIREAVDSIFVPVSAAASAEASQTQPVRFRLTIERESLEEYLGLDVKYMVGGFLEVVGVAPDGLVAKTEMLRPGDVIHRVNGAEGFDRMVAECAESTDLAFEVLRLREGTSVDSLALGVSSRPRVPPLKLPTAQGAAQKPKRK
mmetsp:Transcript_36245/g.104241  ORF Transcript_36245/g.104241 Transcript_36245/m.104241 type:complete len:306 (-) Transcript_36245:184-1101(-)